MLRTVIPLSRASSSIVISSGTAVNRMVATMSHVYVSSFRVILNRMFFLAASEPAKGASIHDLLIGGAIGAALTIAVLWVASAHRAGRIRWLGRLAGFSERVSGLPGWCALPSAIVGGSLCIAVFGFYWDVAKHIDTGRDPSPFGTPAHYPILVGLGGIALGGIVAVVLGAPKSVPTSVRITRDWYAPLGGVLVLVCGIFALAGFPLDDVWHRLFGQDVTLWGPTHVLMVGGASLATLGMWVLLVGGRRAMVASGNARGREPWILRLRTVAAGGAFLLGLSALQGEFDYGVPQFQLVFQPILIMLAAGIGLVAARIRIGPGGALYSVLFWLVVRGLLALVIAGPLGRSTPHFPLYVVEALGVELVAARVGTDRPLRLAVWSGLWIGTAGLAAEWAWSHAWMPLPWPSSLLPEAVLLGFAAAMSGALLGGAIGRALTSKRESPPIARGVTAAAGAVAVFCIAFPMPMTAEPLAARLSLTPAGPGHVNASVRLSDARKGGDAQWLTVTAWQGGSLVVDRLKHVGGPVWRTTEPIPVTGDWKALVRLEDDRDLLALPISMPRDTAIPAPGIPPRSGTRAFVRDKKLLQRESVGGSQALKIPAYLLLALIVIVWLAAMTWGLRRLDASVRGREPDRGAPPSSTRVAVPA